MTSAIPYDPDDFDNNPFAEQSTHSLIPEVPVEVARDVSAIANEQQRELEQQEQQPKSQQTTNLIEETVRSSLNSYPTDQDLKRYIPERLMVGKIAILLKVDDIEKNGNGSNSFKNPIIKFNGVVRGIPGYRKTSYKNVRRTYKELEAFNTFLKLNNLEVFVPSLPLIPTLYNYGSQEFKNSLSEMIQIWFDRVVANPILITNSEFVLFLENNDFHYSPSKTKPSNIVMATGLKRKTLKQLQTPYDESLDLASFRPLMKLTYVTMMKLNENLATMDKYHKRLSHQLNEFNTKIADLEQVENDVMMQKSWSKIAKNLNIVNELDLIKNHITISNMTNYVNLVQSDTYTIKESLTNRHLLMRELINAEDSTKRKSAVIAKLKNKPVIDSLKVEEAIKSIERATLTQEKLQRDVIRTTFNMSIERKDYLQFLTAQTREVFRKLAISSIENERKKLMILENFKGEFRQLSSIKGGLARLGRENNPVSPTKFSKSQTSNGDSWSGRTTKRQGDLISDIESTITEDIIEETNVDASTTDENVVVNAKSAASLLGPSTF